MVETLKSEKDKVLQTNPSTNLLSELQVTTCKPLIVEVILQDETRFRVD
ncbi:hypothetical protein HanIR_Chr13g0666381 [Helianthus annuus]|nr:hypothetical protein HanIR_Chr13g0666381 [Helianthus annuus]